MAITKTPLSTKCHIEAVLSDPEYLASYNIIGDVPDRISKLKALLFEYGLELDDLNFNVRNNGFALYINPDTMFSAGDLEYIKNRKEFFARFDDDIKKAQFNELWALIKKNQERIGITKTKPKVPLNSKLLYAIFKARKNKLTFSKIFKLYQDKQLPYYDKGSNRQYTGEDSLERYYRKYYKNGHINSHI